MYLFMCVVCVYNVYVYVYMCVYCVYLCIV